MQTAHSYYDILGVAQDATLEEITLAKNNLAKIYHPDVNIHCNANTTLRMQEILEAYQFLRDHNKRQEYDQGLQATRHFKTFQVDEAFEHDEDSFVRLWQAAHNLHYYLSESLRIHEENQHLKKSKIPLLKKPAKDTTHLSPEVCEKLQVFKQEIMASIDFLSKGNIPAPLWHLEAMNWVLIRWSQKQNANYLALFHRYEHDLESTSTRKMRFKRRREHRQFEHQLTQILSFSY